MQHRSVVSKVSCSRPRRGHLGWVLWVGVALLPGWAQEATVTVDVTATGHNVSPLLTGVNLSYFNDLDSLWADGRFASNLRALRAGILRYPGGEETSRFHWEKPGTRGYLDRWIPDLGTGKAWSAADIAMDNPDHMSPDEYLGWCRVIGAEPMLGVNYASGLKWNRFEDSVAEAVGWIRHCKEKGVKVKYWFIGNEPFHKGTWHQTRSPDYGKAVKDMAVALRSVDPEISIVANPFNNHDEIKREKLAEFLSIAGPHVDVIDIHWYWQWGEATWGRWLAEAPMRNSDPWTKNPITFEEEAARFRQLAADLGYPKLQLAAHEWNLGPPTKTNGPTAPQHALMATEMLMQFARGNLHSSCIWPLVWFWEREKGLSNLRASIAKGAPVGFRSVLDPLPPHGVTPAWQAIVLFSECLGKTSVDSRASIPEVPVFAVKDSEGLRVFLLNKEPAGQAVAFTLSLEGMGAARTEGLALRMEGDTLVSGKLSITADGKTLTGVIPPFSFTRILVFPKK